MTNNRKLSDPARSKAIVNDAWRRIRSEQGYSPSWRYIAVVSLVDRLIVDMDDARDVGDALVLCAVNDETPTKAQILHNIGCVQKGRMGGTFK